MSRPSPDSPVWYLDVETDDVLVDRLLCRRCSADAVPHGQKWVYFGALRDRGMSGNDARKLLRMSGTSHAKALRALQRKARSMSADLARSVGCPNCQASPGSPCTQPHNEGRRSVPWFHSARQDLADGFGVQGGEK